MDYVGHQLMENNMLEQGMETLRLLTQTFDSNGYPYFIYEKRCWQ
jgi:hypothetical protein